MADEEPDNVRMVFTLRQSDIDALEKLRAAMGLRSRAAVLRKLVRDKAKEKLT
jgi:hypothetical protein